MGHDLVCLSQLPEDCTWSYEEDEGTAYPDDINVRDARSQLIGWIELKAFRAVGRSEETNVWNSVKTESAQQAADYLSAQMMIGNWQARRRD